MNITRRQLLKWMPGVIPVIAAIPLIARKAPEKVQRTTKRYNEYHPGRSQLHVDAFGRVRNEGVRITWKEFK